MIQTSPAFWLFRVTSVYFQVLLDDTPRAQCIGEREARRRPRIFPKERSRSAKRAGIGHKIVTAESTQRRAAVSKTLSVIIRRKMEKQHSPAPDLLTVLLPSWNIYISRLERVTTLARVLAASPLCRCSSDSNKWASDSSNKTGACATNACEFFAHDAVYVRLHAFS